MDVSIPYSTIPFMIVLLLLSAFFSATETAFSSLNRTRLKVLENQGNKKAEHTLQLLEDFDSILSTVLIGNNIVNIALASMAAVFFIRLIGNYGSTLSTIVVTIVVLIFGEITPKSIAKNHAESIAMYVSPIIKFLNKVFLPLNKLFSMWKNWVSKVIKTEDSEKTISDDELLTILDEATDLGGIDTMESTLIRNAIEFSDVKVEDILVPRTKIVAVHKDASVEEITQAFLESNFSRLPVYDENIDDIIGTIHYKDFMSNVRILKKPLQDCIQEVKFISPGENIHDVLQILQKDKKHIAIVADEYGGTMGIITMEDILEELVGEIFDETDEVQEYIHKLEDDVYLVDTSAEADKVFAFFGIEEETESNTIGGWVSEKLNAIPKENDEFDSDIYHVLVTKADIKRATEIKLTIKVKESE